jgi:chromosome segregation ATPase
MRKGLIITTILAAMLVGVLMFSVYLMEQKEERMELYHQQMQMLEEQAAKLDVKEAQLNELVQRYENGQTDGAAELAAMKTELETLQAEKQELQLQLEQAIADVQAMRQQLENEDSDQSYYLEVYNALTEGLNKVKGYIAGN